MTDSDIFLSGQAWNPERPRILVVACSDGRLQENLDEFLERQLNITRYNRLYAPGGPGALGTSGIEFLRSDQFRREFTFLVQAHRIEEVFLIFHGPSESGPDEAVCADYRRIFPHYTAEQIRMEQEKDMREIAGSGFPPSVHLHVYRCEVTGAGAIQFVRL